MMISRVGIVLLILGGCGLARCLDVLNFEKTLATSNYVNGKLEKVGTRHETVYHRYIAPANYTWICLQFIEFRTPTNQEFRAYANGCPQARLLYSGHLAPFTRCLQVNYMEVFFNQWLAEGGFAVEVLYSQKNLEQNSAVIYQAHKKQEEICLTAITPERELEIVSPGVYLADYFQTPVSRDGNYFDNSLSSRSFHVPAGDPRLTWICVHFTKFDTEFNKDKLYVVTDGMVEGAQYSGERKPFTLCRNASEVVFIFVSDKQNADLGILGYVTFSLNMYEAPKKNTLTRLDGNEKDMELISRSKRTGTYQAPSHTYRSPSYTYRSPSYTYRSPSYTYRSPSYTYRSPSYTYRSPSYTYQPPSYTYRSPSYTYRSPSYTYRSYTTPRTYQPYRSYRSYYSGYAPTTRTYSLYVPQYEPDTYYYTYYYDTYSSSSSGGSVGLIGGLGTGIFVVLLCVSICVRLGCRNRNHHLPSQAPVNARVFRPQPTVAARTRQAMPPPPPYSTVATVMTSHPIATEMTLPCPPEVNTIAPAATQQQSCGFTNETYGIEMDSTVEGCVSGTSPENTAQEVNIPPSAPTEIDSTPAAFTNELYGIETNSSENAPASGVASVDRD